MSTERWWNNTYQKKKKAGVPGNKLVLPPFCPPQTPHGRVWNRTRAFAERGWWLNGLSLGMFGHLKADSHIACRAYAVPLPCHATNRLECVFPIWFTQCGRVWFKLAMPRPCHALTMPFFSRPQHSTAVERRPVGYLPAFGIFRLPRGVPRRLLSEAYQSSSQRSIPATVKSGSSTLQKGQSVKLLD
jgi:hypothetical protein